VKKPWPEIVKRIRNSLGYSQRSLGAILGVAINTVSWWETGRTEPSGAKKTALLAIWKDSGLGPLPEGLEEPERVEAVVEKKVAEPAAVSVGEKEIEVRNKPSALDLLEKMCNEMEKIRVVLARMATSVQVADALESRVRMLEREADP
jgi:transcriptional regulator with XRE-family HTH domain